MSEPLLQKTIESLDIGDIQDEVNTAVASTKPQSNTIRNVLIGAGAILGSYFLFIKSAKASDQPKTNLRTDMFLTKNMQLKEFLISSEIPEIKDYSLSAGEYANVVRVANLLQKIRDRFGVSIFVTSGGRPATLVARSGKYAGMNLVQILTEKGFKPSAYSQHMDFSAADFTVEDKNKLIPIYEYLQSIYRSSPGLITQFILYIENGVPDFIHLGVHSDMENFEKIVGSNIDLLARVTVTTAANGSKTRSTKFLNYSPENLDSLLSVA